MASHVAILLAPYLELLLSGRKTVESRLYRQQREPFGCIAPGEVIWFKQSAGPYRARATARQVHFTQPRSPDDMAQLQARWNDRVCGDDAYWQWKAQSRYAVFIELKDVQAVATGPRLPKSQGRAWFVLPDAPPLLPVPLPAQPAPGMTIDRVTLTAGALRNNYVPAPPQLRTLAQRGKPTTLLLPDGVLVPALVRGRLFRFRGWGPYFATAGVTPGSQIGFEPAGRGRYRVRFLGPSTEA